MNAEFQLKLQALLDGELSEREARAIETALATDADAVRKESTTAADSTALGTLQTDLKATLAGGTLDFSKLLTDQAAVLSSQGVSQATITQLQADEQAVFTASGITQADLTTIANDQAAIPTANQGQTGSFTAPGDGSGSFGITGGRLDRGQY